MNSVSPKCVGVANNECVCHSHNGFLTRRGYLLARALGVDKAEELRYLDKVGSVSGVRRDETLDFWLDDVRLDEQALRSLPQGV